VKTKDEKFADKKKYSLVRMFIRLSKKIFRFAPIGLTVFLLAGLLQGVGYGFNTLIQQYFFDSAGKLFHNSDKEVLKAAIVALLVYVGTDMILEVINSFVNLYFSLFYDRMSGLNQRELNMKLARISPIKFEDTQVLDDIEKASQGMYASVFFVLIVSMIFTFYLPYFITMGWYLFKLKPILVIAIVIVFIPVLLSRIIRAKIYTKVEDKSAPKRREMSYYESCCTQRALFKETRLLGAYTYFHNLYRECLKAVQKLSWRASLKTGLLDLSMSLISLMGYIIIIYLTFKATMDGDISVGAFVAIINSIGMLFGVMEELIGRHFANISDSLPKVRNYIRILEFEEHGGKDMEKESEYDIIVKNVSFSYPVGKKEEKDDKKNGKDKKKTTEEKVEAEEAKEPVYAVKNASLTIKNGETIAIVGENGSGKSTLVRLLTGMYRPTKGDVFHGSHNTKDLSLKSTFANTSGVFQKYQRYQMTLSDNISISNTEQTPTQEKLTQVCDMAGVAVEERSFPQGFDTMLSREFDGVDLSGGQWQRIAIARGFYRNHNFIVLDEPTAAIDPLEERNIYDRFAEISKNKTAAIVTHRLGSVKLADRIVMMEKGEIIGIGTHKELYDTCPQYARLWDSQADSYK
jgi:ATP-binding cassette subfamily B protein